MSWPEAFAVVGGAWALTSLPLGVMVKAHMDSRLILKARQLFPDLDVKIG